MAELILAAVGSAVLTSAAFRFWTPLARKVPTIPVDDLSYLPAKRRTFRVVLSTNSGAQARMLFEKVVPKENSDGLVEFYDGDVCRGTKTGKESA